MPYQTQLTIDNTDALKKNKLSLDMKTIDSALDPFYFDANPDLKKNGSGSRSR